MVNLLYWLPNLVNPSYFYSCCITIYLERVYMKYESHVKLLQCKMGWRYEGKVSAPYSLAARLETIVPNLFTERRSREKSGTSPPLFSRLRRSVNRLGTIVSSLAARLCSLQQFVFPAYAYITHNPFKYSADICAMCTHDSWKSGMHWSKPIVQLYYKNRSYEYNWNKTRE